jgi:hypothetical protein
MCIFQMSQQDKSAIQLIEPFYSCAGFCDDKMPCFRSFGRSDPQAGIPMNDANKAYRCLSTVELCKELRFFTVWLKVALRGSYFRLHHSWPYHIWSYMVNTCCAEDCRE